MIPFDTKTRVVTGPARSVKLTPTRAEVLKAIPVHPAAIKTPDLLRAIWGTHTQAARRKNVCRVTVYQLRCDLADAGFGVSAIGYEPGRGYSVRA